MELRQNKLVDLDVIPLLNKFLLIAENPDSQNEVLRFAITILLGGNSKSQAAFLADFMKFNSKGESVSSLVE